MNRATAAASLVALIVFIGCKSNPPPSKNEQVIDLSSVPTTQYAATQMVPMRLDEAMKLIDSRGDWKEFGPIQVPKHPAEKYLKGMTIVIDPGHGGTDGGDSSTRPAAFKAGPSGTKEAHMNLRVGLLLERLLKDAGVNVILTRHGDETLSLVQRAEVANNAKKLDGSIGADLFISIHHNAAGGVDKTNFTSVWYHGQVDGAEVALDVGRHIAAELGKAMRTDVGLTSPLFSDQLMYDGGFGVLRACHVPGVLCECSFYTNREEEQRLRDAGYNLREAYAIYEGLCEYAYEGRPTQAAPVVSVSGDVVTMTVPLDEGLPKWWGSDRSRILRSSVYASWDERPMRIEFDPKTKVLRGTAPVNAPPSPATTQATSQPAWWGSLREGEHVLSIHFENMFKHSNWPQRYSVTLLGRETKVEAMRPAPARPEGGGRNRGRNRSSTTRATTTTAAVANEK